MSDEPIVSHVTITEARLKNQKRNLDRSPLGLVIGAVRAGVCLQSVLADTDYDRIDFQHFIDSISALLYLTVVKSEFILMSGLCGLPSTCYV